jgi:hypothetical protein
MGRERADPAFEDGYLRRGGDGVSLAVDDAIGGGVGRGVAA